MLTGRQEQVLEFLRDYMAREGMPPTQKEIADAFGFTQKAAAQHLRLMAAKGVLEVRRDLSRGIRLLDRPVPEPPGGPPRLPLIGRVAAGSPVLATDDVEEWVEMSPELFRPRADYLRRVVGNSMADFGIRNGDLVGVKQVPEARSGQIIVARLSGAAGAEITVKRFQREAGQVRLIAYNPDVEDIVVSLEIGDESDQRRPRIEIEGLYCGHFHPHSGH